MSQASEDLPALPPRPTGSVLSPEEADAWSNGFGFLEAAQREATALRSAAREAYKDEYAHGFASGKAKGEEEAARIVAEATTQVDRYLSSIEGDIIALAIDVARRVLGEFDGDEMIAKAARNAISQMRRARYFKVSVHPNAADTVRAQLDEIAASAEFPIEVLPDAGLSRHACIVATDIAVLDAGIEAQLSGIQSALKAEADRRT